MQKKGLGRGLESLLRSYDSDSEIISKQTGSGISEVNISLVDPNPKQPRRYFEPEALNDLAKSIKEHGVIQPVILTKRGDRYMIVAGERRWRASKLAEQKTIPAIIKEFTEKQIKEITIIENLQREDLNPIETAQAIHELMQEFGLTQEVVAERIGKSRPAIANALRLLTLANETIKLVQDGRLSAGHARALVIIADKALQVKLANMACDNKMTVRDLEKAVRDTMNKKPTKKEAQQTLELKDFASNLKRVFATKVTIKGTEEKGKISIEYFSKDDLQRIYELVERLKK